MLDSAVVELAVGTGPVVIFLSVLSLPRVVVTVALEPTVVALEAVSLALWVLRGRVVSCASVLGSVVGTGVRSLEIFLL